MEPFLIGGKSIADLHSTEHLKEAFMLFLDDALSAEDADILHDRLINEDGLQAIYDDAVAETVVNEELGNDLAAAIARQGENKKILTVRSYDARKNNMTYPSWRFTGAACLASLVLGFAFHAHIPWFLWEKGGVELAVNDPKSPAENVPRGHGFQKSSSTMSDDFYDERLVEYHNIKRLFESRLQDFDFGIKSEEDTSAVLKPSQLSPTKIDSNALWIRAFEGTQILETEISINREKYGIEILKKWYENRDSEEGDIDIDTLRSAVNEIIATISYCTEADADSLYQSKLWTMMAFVAACSFEENGTLPPEATQIAAVSLWGYAEASKKLGSDIQNIRDMCDGYAYALATMQPDSDSFETIQARLREAASQFENILKSEERRIRSIINRRSESGISKDETTD